MCELQSVHENKQLISKFSRQTLCITDDLANKAGYVEARLLSFYCNLNLIGVRKMVTLQDTIKQSSFVTVQPCQFCIITNYTPEITSCY